METVVTNTLETSASLSLHGRNLTLINLFDTKVLMHYCRHFVLGCFLFSHGPSFVSCLRYLACCALLRAWDLPGLQSLIKR